MQGAQELRSESRLQVRRNNEVEAQSRSERDRWTFYETINFREKDGRSKQIQFHPNSFRQKDKGRKSRLRAKRWRTNQALARISI